VIITRSPLRITLGGGGTDLPSYYREHEGFLVAAAIDRYVYITLHQTFVPELIVKYSQLERVAAASELRHPLLRECFTKVGLDGRYLELTSMADIPAGTGLGSSGSFSTATLEALYAWQHVVVPVGELAREACSIEIERLGDPVGKQDPYVAAFGGLRSYRFRSDETVEVEPLRLASATLYDLEDNLLLFFTGYSRTATTILRDQDERSQCLEPAMLDNLHFVKQIGLDSRAALEAGNLARFAELLDVQWEWKRRRSAATSNPAIDGWYELGRRHGALGGKLVGAGGGGFLMFLTEDRARLRHAMTAAGLPEVRFRFDFEGTKVVSL